MINRIIVVRPYGYYGGTLVLDVLTKLLRDKGVDARIFYTPYSYINKSRSIKYIIRFWLDWLKITIKSLLPLLIKNSSIAFLNKRLDYYRRYYSDSMSGLRRQLFPFLQKGTLVVYPEVMYGNFLHAKNVIRWLLYYNRFQNDKKWYNKNDLFICYREIFNDWNLNPDGKCVCLSFFDANKYYQSNFGIRSGKCYIVRKGSIRSDLPAKFDGTIIDDLDEEEKVRILNQCQYCYSYDTQTFYCTIAAVCGCIPVVVLEPGKSASDYLSPSELNKSYGIAYGDSFEELKRAKDTRNLLLKSLDYETINNQNIIKFIAYVEGRFGDVCIGDVGM